MPYFRDTRYTREFRAMFERLPPYSLHNLRASLHAEEARLRAAEDANFAARTQLGIAPQDRLAANPAINGLNVIPESMRGRIVGRSA